MNSSKRGGPAYGFKLNSLDTTLDAKSNDKNVTLLQYIVQVTIAKKFRYLLNIDQEIEGLENTEKISLQSLLVEFKELEKGMILVEKEKNHSVIKDFLQEASITFKNLKSEVNSSQKLYKDCITYFGDSSATLDSNEFFPFLLKFLKAFKNYAKDVKPSPRTSKETLISKTKWNVN